MTAPLRWRILPPGRLVSLMFGHKTAHRMCGGRLAGEHFPDGVGKPMLRLLLAMTVTVALGLASRLHPTGWFLWDRVLGEVLYAVAAYIVWAMILGRKPPLVIAGIAFASCLAVELFKLTGIPAENQHGFLVRWFLGMAFSVANLGYCLIGVVLSAFADGATRA